MILTGKANEDFYKWLHNSEHAKHVYCSFQDAASAPNYEFKYEDVELPEILENALIIDFFDSVGIFIHPKRFTHCLKFQFWYFIIENSKGVYLFDGRCVEELKNNHIANDSRQEAISKAIEKANEIYNGKHQRNNESK